MMDKNKMISAHEYADQFGPQLESCVFKQLVEFDSWMHPSIE